MIEFSTAITDLAGQPLKEGETIATVRSVTVNALQALFADEQNLAGGEKVHRALLAQRIYDAKEPLALKVEDVALIKKLVGKAYGPLVVMRAWAVLDPQAVKQE